MIEEGSVLAASSLRGRAVDVAPEGFAHPVYRAGFALAVAVPQPPPAKEPTLRETVAPVPELEQQTEPEPEAQPEEPATPEVIPEIVPDVVPEIVPEAIPEPAPEPELPAVTEPEPEQAAAPEHDKVEG